VISDLPSGDVVIAGSRGNDGRTARSRQCELLERFCALHVGSGGLRL
jgi:hypothetical protein